MDLINQSKTTLNIIYVELEIVENTTLCLDIKFRRIETHIEIAIWSIV